MRRNWSSDRRCTMRSAMQVAVRRSMPALINPSRTGPCGVVQPASMTRAPIGKSIRILFLLRASSRPCRYSPTNVVDNRPASVSRHRARHGGLRLCRASLGDARLRLVPARKPSSPPPGQLGTERSLRGDLRRAILPAHPRRGTARLVARLHLDRGWHRRLWRDLFRLSRRHRPSPHRHTLSAALLLYETDRPGAPTPPCRRNEAGQCQFRVHMGAEPGGTKGRAKAPRACRGPHAGRRRRSRALTLPIAFWIAAIVAVTMLGLSKGGFAGMGALALPLIALTISPVQAAAILLPVLIVQDVVGVWAFRKSWDGYVLGWMLHGSIIGIALAWAFARYVPESAVLGLVGAISIVFGLYRLWVDRGGALRAPARSPGWLGAMLGLAS